MVRKRAKKGISRDSTIPHNPPLSQNSSQGSSQNSSRNTLSITGFDDGASKESNAFFSHLTSTYGISKEEFLELAQRKQQELEESIPVSILNQELSSLEAIVKFLRENRTYSYRKISALLHRDPRALATTYVSAKRKKPTSFNRSVEFDTSRIPFTAFSEKLSVLEAIALALKSQGHSYSEIARMLNKDPRTIWTVCKRAEKK